MFRNFDFCLWRISSACFGCRRRQISSAFIWFLFFLFCVKSENLAKDEKIEKNCKIPGNSNTKNLDNFCEKFVSKGLERHSSLEETTKCEFILWIFEQVHSFNGGFRALGWVFCCFCKSKEKHWTVGNRQTVGLSRHHKVPRKKKLVLYSIIFTHHNSDLFSIISGMWFDLWIIYFNFLRYRWKVSPIVSILVGTGPDSLICRIKCLLHENLAFSRKNSN